MSKLCVCCNSSRLKIYSNLNDVFLIQCSECKIIYTWPQPKIAELLTKNELFYGTQQKQVSKFNTAVFLIRRGEKFIEHIHRLRSKGIILDIGSGFGYNSLCASRKGYKTVGVEMSKTACDYSRKILNQNVKQGDLEKIKLPRNYFDIVTTYDVLEHTRNPDLAIKIINKYLKKKGLLVIQSPNIISVMAKLTKEKWTWLLLSFHLIHFSSLSMKKILENNGYKILKLKTRDEYSEFITNILWILKIKPVGKLSFLYSPLFLLFWLFFPFSIIWSKLGFGGIINVYAEKT